MAYNAVAHSDIHIWCMPWTARAALAPSCYMRDAQPLTCLVPALRAYQLSACDLAELKEFKAMRQSMRS